MNIKGKLTKCNFCSYATPTGCMVTPNYYYCKKAIEEFNAHIKGSGVNSTVKSLRKWDRR